jgi:tetratricopeptide (TPR) repeat protein
MYKILILSLLISMPVFAQEIPDYNTVDSISYALFLNENWDELIKTGKEAASHQVNFKRLQQRMGYAYFAKADYHNAIKHYERSLEFDQSDEISHLYLYYAGINIGDEAFARYHASKLSENMKKENKIAAFRPVDAIDFEYNKKMNDYSLRSNPDFLRLGINMQLGYRLNFYQSISRYNQVSEYESGTIYQYTAATEQDEYFGLLSWSVFSKTNLSAGYHYVNTKVDYGISNAVYPGEIWLGRLSQKIHRFNIAVSGSVFSNDSVRTTQSGIQIGVALPGKCSPYLKSAVYNINEYDENRIVFSQTAGLLVLRRVWTEAAITLGNLNNYVNMNGLYFYNSPDATIFRTGLSLFWYQGKHITFFSNYTFDKKEIYQTVNTYNQHSITGGIIWKL